MSGAMSFLELGKVVNESWKACDAVAREVVHELAKEEREVYKERVLEYNALILARVGADEAEQGQKRKTPLDATILPIRLRAG